MNGLQHYIDELADLPPLSPIFRVAEPGAERTYSYDAAAVEAMGAGAPPTTGADVRIERRTIYDPTLSGGESFRFDRRPQCKSIFADVMTSTRAGPEAKHDRRTDRAMARLLGPEMLPPGPLRAAEEKRLRRRARNLRDASRGVQIRRYPDTHGLPPYFPVHWP